MKTGAVGRKRKALKPSLKEPKKKEIAQSPPLPPPQEEPLESASLEQSHTLQSLGAESRESTLLETPDDESAFLDTFED